MQKFPIKLEKSLEKRKQQDAVRKLCDSTGLVDFSSNDYLGFASCRDISEEAARILESGKLLNGATGSRLLSGNHDLFAIAEKEICTVFRSEAALIFNSGYDANLGFFSCIPQRGDMILYDEHAHASIRDGIRLSDARSIKFSHNDLEDLEKKLIRHIGSSGNGEIFVVTETVFSMDGDSPDIKGLIDLEEKYGFFLILDEAHATGVMGEEGRGIVAGMQLQDKVFARILTFGKALGSHGAAILGSENLKQYLVNFSRSFIYTTALPPHSVATIIAVSRNLHTEGKKEVEKLKNNIDYFLQVVKDLELQQYFITGPSAIQCCLIPGNARVKNLAAQLKRAGFDVKPILSPTVPAGKERLRFCLHSYNSQVDIKSVLSLVAKNMISLQ